MYKGTRVVCAANRTECGLIVTGVRHWDVIMTNVFKAMDPNQGVFNYERIEQGFVDEFGNFLTREEAWALAETAGQIKTTGPWNHRNGVHVLYSENLY